MSSPPNSNTSTRAGHLHTPDQKHQQRSLSFPAALNLFHKKGGPEPARIRSPVEPYEVAPGIWNTDATAKVFGYLDSETDKDKLKGHVPKRKPVEPAIPRIPGPQGPSDAVTKSSPLGKPSKFVNSGQQLHHEHTNNDLIKQTRVQQIRSKGMRTVSRDDRLVQRGANPRTGLVSPFITSDSSDDNVARDYLSLGKPLVDRPQPKGRTRSGKWKQDRAGWSLVESPLLSPIAQSTADPLSRKASLKKLEDKLLVQMPGVDNPEPKNMTDEQMKKYQEGMARALKHGGATAMVSPNKLPSPRPTTPEGPSTPPARLHRIRRKAVGSAPGRKQDSNETVLVNSQAKASPLPATRKGSKDTHKVRIKTPSNTPKGSSFETMNDKKANVTESSFLGPRIEGQTGQIRGTTFPPNLQNPQGQQVPSRPPFNFPSPIKAEFVDPPATPTLSQYLPRLHFLHPSHFTNLETSTYRRPTELLPAHLRTLEEPRMTTEDAYTTTTTFISKQELERNQRPTVQRQNESTAVPRVKPYSKQVREERKENCIQEDTPRKKTFSYTNIPADASNSGIPMQYQFQTPKRITLEPGRPKNQHQTNLPSSRIQLSSKGPSQGTRNGVMNYIPDGHHFQQRRETQPERWLGAILPTQESGLGSANTTQDIIETTQGTRGGGAGITHMLGHLGGNAEDLAEKDTMRVGCSGNDYSYKKDPMKPTEIAFKDDGSGWFAGQWANVDQDLHTSEDTHLRRTTLSRGSSLSRKTIDATVILKQSFSALVVQLQASISKGIIQHYLCYMGSHVLKTLHPDSPALLILRASDAGLLDYLRAGKDIILACIFMVLLLNVLTVARKVLEMLATCVYWVWHPVEMGITIVKWCIFL